MEFSPSSRKQFENLLSQGYVLLEFYANWCGTCRSVTRMLKHLETKKCLEIIRVDIDTAKDLSSQFEVLGVPLLVLMYKNEEVMRIGGSLNFEEFKLWIHSVDEFKELS
jgi:thioredoxin 1